MPATISIELLGLSKPQVSARMLIAYLHLRAQRNAATVEAMVSDGIDRVDAQAAVDTYELKVLPGEVCRFLLEVWADLDSISTAGATAGKDSES